jgi:thiamine transporter ThiT
VVIGLALSVNILGLMGLIEKHVTVSPSLRILAYIAALTSGGFVGLFSRRITSRITTWRDQK